MIGRQIHRVYEKDGFFSYHATDVFAQWRGFDSGDRGAFAGGPRADEFEWQAADFPDRLPGDWRYAAVAIEGLREVCVCRVLRRGHEGDGEGGGAVCRGVAGGGLSPGV